MVTVQRVTVLVPVTSRHPRGAKVQEARCDQRDPLFRDVFAYADRIDVTITPTANGLRVVETSSDPAVATLVQAHAEVVNAFLKNGMSEMMKVQDRHAAEPHQRFAAGRHPRRRARFRRRRSQQGWL